MKKKCELFAADLATAVVVAVPLVVGVLGVRHVMAATHDARVTLKNTTSNG